MWEILAADYRGTAAGGGEVMSGAGSVQGAPEAAIATDKIKGLPSHFEQTSPKLRRGRPLNKRGQEMRFLDSGEQQPLRCWSIRFFPPSDGREIRTPSARTGHTRRIIWIKVATRSHRGDFELADLHQSDGQQHSHQHQQYRNAVCLIISPQQMTLAVATERHSHSPKMRKTLSLASSRSSGAATCRYSAFPLLSPSIYDSAAQPADICVSTKVQFKLSRPHSNNLFYLFGVGSLTAR